MDLCLRYAGSHNQGVEGSECGEFGKTRTVRGGAGGFETGEEGVGEGADAVAEVDGALVEEESEGGRVRGEEVVEGEWGWEGD